MHPGFCRLVFSQHLLDVEAEAEEDSRERTVMQEQTQYEAGTEVEVEARVEVQMYTRVLALQVKAEWEADQARNQPQTADS